MTSLASAQLAPTVPLTPELSLQELRAAIHAVDRLNSWVRSGSFFPNDESLREVIYFLKREAIMAASSRGLVQHRRVAVETRCSHCGGSGRYTDSYGHEWPHCRRCGSHGIVTLEFIESAISMGGQMANWCSITWHSPIEKAAFAPDRYKWPAHPVEGDWKPNTVGRDLEPSEAARDLNLAESVFTARPRYKRSVYYDDYLCGEVDDFARYSLWIGKTSADRCSVCGSTENILPHSFGARAGRITWSDHACSACDSGRDGSIFNRFPFPSDLAADAHISRWIELHAAREVRS